MVIAGQAMKSAVTARGIPLEIVGPARRSVVIAKATPPVIAGHSDHHTLVRIVSSYITHDEPNASHFPRFNMINACYDLDDSS
jgi:hypothetical protein